MGLLPFQPSSCLPNAHNTNSFNLETSIPENKQQLAPRSSLQSSILKSPNSRDSHLKDSNQFSPASPSHLVNSPLNQCPADTLNLSFEGRIALSHVQPTPIQPLPYNISVPNSTPIAIKLNSQPMITRSQNSSLKPSIFPSLTGSTSSILSEPTSFSQSSKDLLDACHECRI